MNRHESYVSLELAKILKTARFDWVVNSRWENWNLYPKDKDFFLNTNLGEYENINETGGFCAFSAPTLAVAQRWLREEKYVDVLVEKRFCAYVYSLGNLDDRSEKVIPQMSVGYDTYEQALEAGIQKCLTIILNKTK